MNDININNLILSIGEGDFSNFGDDGTDGINIVSSNSSLN